MGLRFTFVVAERQGSSMTAPRDDSVPGVSLKLVEGIVWDKLGGSPIAQRMLLATFFVNRNHKCQEFADLQWLRSIGFRVPPVVVGRPPLERSSSDGRLAVTAERPEE